MTGADTIPTGENGDAYLLRLILHDWNNEDSIAILSSIRQAMGTAKAKLLIVEVCLFSCPHVGPGTTRSTAGGP